MRDYKSYYCPAGRVGGECYYRRIGYGESNCPLIRSGEYASWQIETRPIDAFYQQNYYGLYSPGRYEYVSLEREVARQHWINLATAFSSVSQIKTLFFAISDLCNSHSTNLKKALATIDALSLLDKPRRSVSTLEAKKLIVKSSIDIASNFANDLIQTTDFYINARDKEFVIFGIRLATEAVKQLVDLIR